MATPFRIVFLLSLFGFLSAAVAEELEPRVFVLDTDTRAVSAVSLESGEVLGTAQLEGKPWRMVVSPDGRRVIALEKGKGKQTEDFGYHPKERSVATIIDSATMEVVARTTLGFTVSTGLVIDGLGSGGSWVFSPDGRYMTLACFGYRSKKPKETLPAELVTLDLDSGEVERRLEVQGRIDSMIATPNAATVIVYSAYRKGEKKQPPLAAGLSFVNLETLEVLERVSLEGEPGPPTVSPDGGYLYLLELGKPDKKPEKHINARVQVVSLAERAYKVSLDMGSGPRGIIVDEQGEQVFVLSDSPPANDKKKKEDRPGLLHIIRNGDTTATIEVGYGPRFAKIAPGGEKLYVVSDTRLGAVDLIALRKIGGGKIENAGINWLSSGSSNKGASELSISPDGNRGYALYGESSKLVVYDLEHNTTLAELTTGRGNVKFAKFLGAGVANVGCAISNWESRYEGGWLNRRPARSSSGWSSQCDADWVAAASTTIVFGPEAKFVYVLNTHSNDVSILDTASNAFVDKIGVGGDARSLTLLPGGNLMAVRTGQETLHLIDTATKKKISEQNMGGNFVLTPDERHAVALGDGVRPLPPSLSFRPGPVGGGSSRSFKISPYWKTLVCLDGTTLKTIATVSGKFKKLTQVEFLPLPEEVAPPATP